MDTKEQEKIFKLWLESYKGLIFRLTRAYASSVQDRDDLFQDILLQLWSSIPNFKGNSQESTWVYRVALNTALVWRRGRKRRHKFKRCLIEIGSVDEPAGTKDDFSDNQEVVDSLYVAIRQLSIIDSSIVLMHLDGLSYKQMAEVIGISENNIGVKLNRAKKHLARLLKGLVNEI